MKILMKSLGVILFIGYATFLMLHHEAASIQKIDLTKPADIIKADDTENSKVDKTESDAVQMVSVMRSSGEIELPLEEYLIGVVASEMPVTFELEALKAQAVAARTFASARGYNVDDTTASQVYKDNEQLKNQWVDQYDNYYEKVKQAVEATAGQILVYNDEPITAAFFSSCADATNNAEDYWQNEVPYLKSVPSPWDRESTDIVRNADVDNSTLMNIFGSSDITILSSFENGYVKEVQAGSSIYTGRQIREMLGLASSCFTIETIDNGVRFITYGSGHGIGMSQYGAQGMASAGYTYDEILHHYYTGAEIKTTLV